jgi:hypothetical protein
MIRTIKITNTIDKKDSSRNTSVDIKCNGNDKPNGAEALHLLSEAIIMIAEQINGIKKESHKVSITNR